MEKKLKVGMAYSSFFSSFSPFFDGLEVIKSYEEVSKYDLIIFSGGNDINPSTYGERNTHSYSVDDERDSVERRIFERAHKLEKKMLGVCRGLQLINIMMGGQLHQDIYLDANVTHPGVHNLEYRYNHVLKGILPQTVNSLHHQGISYSPPSMHTIATYKDIPEVCISSDNKKLTVQFHPEFMGLVKFFNYVKDEWAVDYGAAKISKITFADIPEKVGRTGVPISFTRVSHSTEQTHEPNWSFGDTNIPDHFISSAD